MPTDRIERMRDQLPPVLTPAQVATLYAVSAQTVQRWAKSGRLPSFKTVGGNRRFYRDTILNHLAEQELYA